MAKKNWSSVDAPSDYRKPVVARMRQRTAAETSECITKIDFAIVAASFAAKSDPDRNNYAPVIVNRRLVR